MSAVALVDIEAVEKDDRVMDDDCVTAALDVKLVSAEYDAEKVGIEGNPVRDTVAVIVNDALLDPEDKRLELAQFVCMGEAIAERLEE